MKKIIFLFSMILFAVSSHVALAAAIAAPTINIAPTSYYSLDEILYIEGRAVPNKNVELLFEKPSSQPVRMTVKANSNGEWYFGERLELVGGEWMARARIVDGDIISDWSNPRIVRSIISGFNIGSLQIKYLPIFIVLVLLFAAGFALLLYSFIRARNIKYADRAQAIEKKAEDLKRQLRDRELQSAKDSIEKSFADLRKDLLDELEHLERRSKDGALTKEEEDYRETMLRQLRHVEDDVEKQIKDLTK